MRVLFVAMASHVHTVRWLRQLNRSAWDVHLFAVDEHLPPSPLLADMTLHSLFRPPDGSVEAGVRHAGIPWPVSRGRMRARVALERAPGGIMSRAARLARTIRRLRPTVVHSLEMQHAAYLTLESRKRRPSQFPPWIYSSWGSDLFYFGRRPEHAPRITEVLRCCEYLITDCQRDIGLARELGFHGEALGVFPGAGGYDIDEMSRLRAPGRPSRRRVIALKGREHDEGMTSWGGRALIALEALQLIADELEGYEIVIYMASPQVEHVAAYVSKTTGLRCRILPHRPPHEIYALMGSARLSIGLSVTDGTPNAMLEAMTMGALPIQSDTVSTREWITDGRNGLLVPPENAPAVAAAIRRALHDHALVDGAADLNVGITRDRLDSSVIGPRVASAYAQAASTALG